MRFTETDGGRIDAGFKGTTGDCVTRAIALALRQPYRYTYNELRDLGSKMTGGLERSPRGGVSTPVSHRYLIDRGWSLTVCKPKTYLQDLSRGRRRYIAVLPRHLCFVADGTVFDAWDSRKDNRTKNGSPVLRGYYCEMGPGSQTETSRSI